MNRPSCATRISADALRFADEARREGDVRAGAQPHANAALTARRRAGRGFLAEHVSRRHLGIGPPAFVDAELQVEAWSFRWWRRQSTCRSGSGTVTWRARTATRMAMPAKRKKVPASAPASSRILPKFQTRVRSGSPTQQWYYGSRRGCDAAGHGRAKESFEAVAEGQRLVRTLERIVGALVEESRTTSCVFLGLARTRAVDQAAARPRPVRRRGPAAGAAPSRIRGRSSGVRRQRISGSRRTVPRPEQGASISTASKAASRKGSGPSSGMCTTRALVIRQRRSVRCSSRTRCGRTSQATIWPRAPAAALSADRLAAW